AVTDIKAKISKGDLIVILFIRFCGAACSDQEENENETDKSHPIIVGPPLQDIAIIYHNPCRPDFIFRDLNFTHSISRLRSIHLASLVRAPRDITSTPQRAYCGILEGL